MKKLFLLIMALIGAALSHAQNDGDNFFDTTAIHEIHLNFDDPNYWDTLVSWKGHANLTGDNVYISAEAIVDGVVYDSIGVRLKGNSSYDGYPGFKKPFKLKFNEYISGQKIDGLKKLTLNNGFNDPTMLREKILLDYERKHNIAAPRATFAKVYLNGSYWGLYSVIEQIDKIFLGDYFPENDGNLFKGDPMGRFNWEGPAESAYHDNLELKTNETANDWSDVVHFIDIVNNSTAADFKDSLNAVFNTTEFLRNNAVNTLFVSLDTYTGMGHNFYIYHNLQSDQFEWITWDANSCFGVFNNGMTIAQLKDLPLLYIRPPVANLPLINNIYADNDLKNEYLTHAANFLGTDFDTTNFYAQIDSLADRIRADVYVDTQKMFTNNEFEENLEYTVVTNGTKQIPALKDFLADRIEAVTLELESFGIYIGIEDVTAEDQIAVYPNPIQNNVTVQLGELRVQEVEVFNLYGQSVFYKQLPRKQTSIALNMEEFSNGYFLIKLNTTNGVFTKKVVKL
jgi:hypothetical protein